MATQIIDQRVWTTRGIMEAENREYEAGLREFPITSLQTITSWLNPRRGYNLFPNAYLLNNRWLIPFGDYDPATFGEIRPRRGPKYGGESTVEAEGLPGVEVEASEVD